MARSHTRKKYNIRLLTVFVLLVASSAIVRSSSPAVTLDLSYLHKTKSTLLTQAVQEALETQNDLEKVDVSASFIGKDITEFMALLQRSDEAKASRRPFSIVAQRNKWTQTEAALLLEAIVGPESEEEAKPNEKQGTKKKRRRRQESKEKAVSDVDEEATNSNTTSANQNVTGSVHGVKDEMVVEDVSNMTSSTKNTSSTVFPTQEDTSSVFIVETPPRVISESILGVDLGWNDLGSTSDTSRNANKAWHQILQRTIRNCDRCPKQLRFPVCGLGPAACRAIGKGIIARYDNVQEGSTELPSPLSLELVGNHAISDPGVAALSAAIRTVATKHKSCTILETLDLSGCSVTDAGVEALAIALQHNPTCVRHLDLSNNLITNEGAAALGRALALREGSRMGKIETLDLSNNKGIEDAGAKVLAQAVEEGAVDNLILRSCHVHADGAAALLTSLRSLALSKQRPENVQLDLSGNPLGILRKKAKSGGSKYSASALKSKATATTTAYMSLIGKTVQKGLKDLGISEGPDTLESDDEEEAQMDERNDEDPSKIKCGALAMADALLLDDEEEEGDNQTPELVPTKSCKVRLGLRHCAFDTRASEALAAIRQELLGSAAKMDMVLDVQMNNVLEEEAVSALRGDKGFEGELTEMADRYLEAMENLRAARQRSLEAARVAQQRMHAEQEMEDAWGTGVDIGGDYDDNEGAWDSDADYDREEDEEDFF